jgi:CubicO group peptidase (beta-lactamase class C family)
MIKLHLPIFLFAIAATVSCVAQESIPNAAEIHSFYEAGLRKNGIVGSSLVLVRQGHVVLQDQYGLQNRTPQQPVDENTTYHWASITKTLTGIAIMQLRDRGLLSLDDPLIKYIPELATVHDPYGTVSQITIRDAMSHSGGFRDATWPWRDQDWQPFEPTQWSQLVAMMPYTDVVFSPGTRFSYSNLGVVFLGEIIERLSGDSYETYMEKNVLRPLGMDHSYFDRSPYFLLRYRSHSWDLKDGKLSEDPFDFNTGITRSNGGLNAPIPDMLKYLVFLLGDPAREAENSVILKRFRNYCGLIKVARSGFPWEKTTKGDVASVYTNCETALKRSSLEEMWKPFLPVTPDEEFPSRTGARDFVSTSFFEHDDGKLRLVGHAGWQNGFRSHFYIDPETRSAYIVAYNTDAQDAAQNTRAFDFELRDYLIDHFFRRP